MKKEHARKLDSVINELSFFVYKEFSSRFKDLTDREDRQLFFLAKILTRLKHVSEAISEDEKVIMFPNSKIREKIK